MTDLGGELLTEHEAAGVLGVDAARLKRWVAMGAVPAIHTPHGPRIRRVDLEPVAAPVIGPQSIWERLGFPRPETAVAVDQAEAMSSSLRSSRFSEESKIRPLFHYTSADVALDHVLARGLLRLAPPTGMNDPFESEPISVTLIIDDDSDDRAPRGQVFAEASDLLRMRCRLTCLTRSGPYDYGPAGFGDGFARARMWAQYAQNHAGVCLAFDQRRLRHAAQGMASTRRLQLYEAAIRYRAEGGLERPISLPHSRASKGMPDLINDLFPVVAGHLYFSKAWDWSTETEYRFLVHGNVDEYEYIDVRRALTGIFCGPRMPDARVNDILSRCRHLAAAGRVFKVSWRNGVTVVVPVNHGSFGAGPEWELSAAPEDPQ